MENNKSVGKDAAKATETMAAVSTADKKTATPSKTRRATEIPGEKKGAAAPKKRTVKKTTESRKTAAKKAEPEVSFFVEYADRQVAATKVLEAAKKHYLSEHKGASMKTVEVYLKPEENAAYYTVNGKGSDQFKVLI